MSQLCAQPFESLNSKLLICSGSRLANPDGVNQPLNKTLMKVISWDVTNLVAELIATDDRRLVPIVVFNL